MNPTHHPAVAVHNPWGTVDPDRGFYVVANRSPIAFNIAAQGDVTRLADTATQALGAAVKHLRAKKREFTAANVAEFLSLPSSAPEYERENYAEHIMLFGRWFLDGMPRIDVGHKHAAMLACTGMAPSIVHEVADHLPWWATAVQVPNGLLLAPLFRCGATNAEAAEVATVIVARMVAVMEGDDSGNAQDQWRASVPAENSSAVLFYLVPSDPSRYDLTTLAFSGVDALASFVQGGRDVVDADPIAADAVLFLRFVLGAIAELSQHRPSRGSGGDRSGPRRKNDGRPVPTLYRVTRDVIVDCRPDMEAYRSRRDAERKGGERTGRSHAAPSVVVNVRGHFKMQPHGERNSLRKLMWIAGYSYGGDGAAVAVRSHRLRHAINDGDPECHGEAERTDRHEKT